MAQLGLWQAEKRVQGRISISIPILHDCGVAYFQCKPRGACNSQVECVGVVDGTFDTQIHVCYLLHCHKCKVCITVSLVVILHMQELVTCAAQPETSLVQFSNPNWPSVIIFASASQFHVYLLRFAQILHQTKNENWIGCNLRLHKAGCSGYLLF